MAQAPQEVYGEATMNMRKQVKRNDITVCWHAFSNEFTYLAISGSVPGLKSLGNTESIKGLEQKYRWQRPRQAPDLPWSCGHNLLLLVCSHHINR
jgi:hypothetical protein